MKNVVKFRGLKIDKTGWVYGFPTHDFKFIFSGYQNDSPDNYEVIPETVTQFSTFFDVNGTEIYVGDCFSRGNFVEFSHGCFNVNGDTDLVFWKTKSIIGNMFQNPELKLSHSVK